MSDVIRFVLLPLVLSAGVSWFMARGAFRRGYKAGFDDGTRMGGEVVEHMGRQMGPLLRRAGVTRAEFDRAMGIRRQGGPSN